MEVNDKMDFSDVSLNCSWSQVKNEVKTAFSFVDCSKLYNESEEEDACSTIVPESCVFLRQPEGSEDPLTIDIATNDPTLILRKIHIISEANFIEVYGLFGEYLKTVFCDLIEEVDGTLAFSSVIDDINLQQVTLKFVGLKGAKQVWLFGGRVWCERDDNISPESVNRLNMERINSRLTEGNYHLSPSAESLKKLVADYVSRNDSAAQGCYENIVAQAARDLSRHRRESAPSHPSTSRQYMFTPQQSSQINPPIEFVKTFIDSSLKNMENRIMDNVTEQIRELELRQNKRLDHILKLLENSIPPSNNNPV